MRVGRHFGEISNVRLSRHTNLLQIADESGDSSVCPVPKVVECHALSKDATTMCKPLSRDESLKTSMPRHNEESKKDNGTSNTAHESLPNTIKQQHVNMSSLRILCKQISNIAKSSDCPQEVVMHSIRLLLE